VQELSISGAGSPIVPAPHESKGGFNTLYIDICGAGSRCRNSISNVLGFILESQMLFFGVDFLHR